MDEANLKKMISGDAKAFEKFYQASIVGLWRYVQARVNNKEISEDLVAESFISFYQNRQNIEHWQAAKAYLYRTTMNNLKKFYNSEKTLSLEPEEVAEETLEETDNETETESSEILIEENQTSQLTKFLEKVLKALPLRYAEVLRLRFLAELTVAEVAQALNLSEGNVKVIQNRALKKAKILFAQIN